MVTITSFVLASVALLATPGPTNTLLAMSGAAVGFRRSVRLLAGEVSGYLIAMVVLIAFIGPVLARLPVAATMVLAASGVYLLYTAWKLWCGNGEAIVTQGTINVRQVFITTLLNPKAIIFAFTIPAGATGNLAGAAPWIAGLAALIVCVGAFWIKVGEAIRMTKVSTLTCRRAGAAALAVFAVVILGDAIDTVWPSS